MENPLPITYKHSVTIAIYKREIAFLNKHIKNENITKVNIELLKKNYKAVFLGITSGVLTSLCSILILAYLFQLDHASYVTLLPKSITTAIGIGVSEELGGYVSITVTIIIITGVIGNMFAEAICKIFKIYDPIAKGIAIGTSSHAVGTAKAMEMGAIEGAMSSLSIVVSGILTVIGANIFAQFM